MRAADARAVTTVAATQAPRKIHIGNGVPRTRLNVPCSCAVATPKMTAVYVAVVSAKMAIDGVMYCAYATVPPGTGTSPPPSESSSSRRINGKTKVKNVTRGVRAMSRARAPSQSPRSRPSDDRLRQPPP